MTSIEIKNNLTAPHFGRESPLHLLIASRSGRADPSLTQYSGTSDQQLAEYWPAQWWGLSSSALYQQFGEHDQQTILTLCNRHLLNEAYFIEKSGLAYCAKMVLMAESTDVAQLYAFIGADEAKHLAWLEPYLDEEEKTQPHGQFLVFLSNLIEQLSPSLLVYLVQIILEGWGLDHYRRLSQGCLWNSLSDVFANILKDEAMHHRSGSLMFKPESLVAEDLATIGDCLKSYAEMVRVGPLMALSAFDRVGGGLSQAQLREALVSLKHPVETNRKLRLLCELMNQPGVEDIVTELGKAGYFQSLTPDEAVAFYVRHR